MKIDQKGPSIVETKPDRDFAYARIVVGLRPFVHDKGPFGLHLVQSNGEVLDVVFDSSAVPDLRKLQILLANNLPPET